MRNRIKRAVTAPPVLAVIAAFCIQLAVLYVPPVIGMADNGDFYRIINGNGVYKLDRYQDDQYFSYFSREYGVYQYFNEYESSIFSSQTLFIRAALALDRLFTGDDHLFDIRFLAALVSVWSLIAIYLLVDYASWGLKKRYGYCVAALAVLIFADTGYTAYFNSFFAESIVLVSFLTAMASALLIFQGRRHGKMLFGLYLFSSAVLISAKQQNAPLGLFLGLLAIPLVFSLFRKRIAFGGSLVRRLRAVTAGASALMIFSLGVAIYVIIPQEFVDINKYHAMTRGVLMASQNPEEALEQFRIDSQYSLLDQSIFYERYPAVDVEGEMLENHFYPHYGFVSVSLYYLSHPGELMIMVNAIARNANSIRPASMGNFERSAGREAGAKTSFFALHSWLKDRIVPDTVGFMIIWTMAMLGLSFQEKQRTLVLLCGILMGLSQIAVSIIGAGDADLSKHLFLYNVAFDFTYFLIVSTVLFRWISQKSERNAYVPPALPDEAEERELETVS